MTSAAHRFVTAQPIPACPPSPPATPAPLPRLDVAILLALKDGARFIEAQLDSLLAQDHPDWHLIVSDDGSADDGAARVRDWAAAHPGVGLRLIRGPGRGHAQNFLHLLRSLDPAPPFAAFCDQDDVWLPGKLDRALSALSAVPEGRPALYFGRVWICNQGLFHLHRSDFWPRPPGFANALVQNIAPGNTIVLNRAAIRLVQRASHGVDRIGAHDWWAYQIITGAGGVVLSDPAPLLLYRQHDRNVIGANRGLRAHLRRWRIVLRGEMRDWTDDNIAALRAASAHLTRHNRALLLAFAAARALPPWRRALALARLGIRRQHRFGTALLWLMTTLGLL
ncbi:MAG: glycosyltransferase [Paracoccaceae bacterium]|nr:glycosyltransferase [Paracoccaceae bacterium]